MRLSGITFLFCNRHLWVYNSTEIQGHNSIKENWDQLFVIFETPSPNVHPCPVPGFFVRSRTPNTSRFHSRLFPATEHYYTLALSTKSINVFNVNTYDMMVWELSNRSHCVIMLLSEFMLICAWSQRLGSFSFLLIKFPPDMDSLIEN